jgi:UDP-N-acetylmuramoyl-tripeptide--D-alanyl-D-alanine ligase
MSFSARFQISLSQLCDVLSAANPNLAEPDLIVNGIGTDTRKLQLGNLFVALKGENFDGHDFMTVAIAQGAIAAVVSVKSLANAQTNSFPQILVEDTLVAYQSLAKWWRIQSNIPIIAITGSAGKTTTKELIAAMLAYYTPKNVHKSQENYNNDIGVAQTLLGISRESDDFGVVEMGMRGKGEIARLCQTALPNVGVITNIGTAHIGRLGSQRAIAEAKCELLAEMSKDGIAILNGEDALLLETAKQVWQGKTLTYGINAGDIQGILEENNQIKVNGKTWKLPLNGRHNALNFLAGLAVLKALGLEWDRLPSDISISLPSGRAQIEYLAGDIVILDQTYNASPEATIAALTLLSETPAKRRWAVLGANRELGEHSQDLHFQIGKCVKELGIDFLLVLEDSETQAIIAGASSVNVQTGKDHQAIAQILIEQVCPGDCLLFKASHSVGMEKALSLLRQGFKEQG